VEGCCQKVNVACLECTKDEDVIVEEVVCVVKRKEWMHGRRCFMPKELLVRANAPRSSYSLHLVLFSK
jgi:hypothetical protein